MNKTRDVIHPTLREFLREWFVKHRVLRSIEETFQEADVECDYGYEPGGSSERRNLTEKYYHALDFTDLHDAQKFLQVMASVLGQIENELEGLGSPYALIFGAQIRSKAQVQDDIKQFRRLLRRYGFSYQDGEILSTIKRTTGEALSAAVNVLSLPYLQKQIQRMNQSVESDPDLAIGTAKELIESACKQILSQQGIEPDSNWKLARLVKETQKGLNLVSDELSNEAKAVGALKKILGSLANIVQGLAELRNQYGTGHGPSPGRTSLEPRHARLAAGAAETLAHFFLETQ